ncbi:MAG: hypothetical protein GX969_06535 [Firmicutes bacterium]|nr:hypothetical protein [Bacillota bacterium]
MSMRSIDVRNVIAKSKEVEGIQKVHHRMAATGQQTFETELSKQAESKSRQVQAAPEADSEKIRSDDKTRKESQEKGENDGERAFKGSDKKTGINDSKDDPCISPGQIIDVEV